MNDSIQSGIHRPDFQRWLDTGTAPLVIAHCPDETTTILKLPKTPDIDYLYGMFIQNPGRISWKNSLSFCGVYDQRSQRLYLADTPLIAVVDGITAEEQQDAGAYAKVISSEVNFYNDQKPGIKLIKVDASDPSRVIPNAKFEIKSVDGAFGPEEYTTDENGEIDLSKLPLGAYVVTEISCPGYIIDEEQRIIQLDGNEKAKFVFTNHIKPSLRLVKKSSDGSPLGGVHFRIAKIEDGTH